MGKAIEVRELTVHYDRLPVLWEINFSIPEGSFAGIIGPNGAGKSTLLKTCLGLHKPIGGSITFFGKPYREARKKIAYVPQRSSVDWDFPITVLDVVVMGRYAKLGPFKWVSKKDRTVARRALEKAGIPHLADRQIRELSGGQQQRVFLARALLQEADLYLMDEPFAGVDMATEKALIALFSSLASDGKTLIVVHHDLTTVKRYFDWIVMLNTCLIAAGPVSETYTEENLAKTYGASAALLVEANRLSYSKTTGES